DGFGVVHRKQASVYELATLLPSAAGELVLREVESLRRVTDQPQRPFVVVLGGAKVADKLAVIDNLLGKADRILIGGGMAYTFQKAKGFEIGQSLLDEDKLDVVREYMQRAEANGVELVLPVDTLVAPEFAADAPTTTSSYGTTPWASSSSRPSPTAPRPSPRPSPRPRGTQWSAAATPPRPCATSASTRSASRTSPPAVVRASS